MVNVFVPWILFSTVFALVSFSYHYKSPMACFMVIALLLLKTVGVSGLFWQSARIRKEKEIDEDHEPMWYGFLCVTCLLAIVVGVILGYHNFNLHMDTVYDFENLATYRDVDPAKFVGQQLVDAGRVQFNSEAHLDISKSMAFKSHDIYCVAPIVSPSTSATTYVDFWAVGKNCCSGTSADFHCGGYKDTTAHGGLRLMDDASRPFYRLAVQQAEATHKIVTHKPLFFVWGTDPIKYTEDLRYKGRTLYIMGVFSAFVVQCVFVVMATLVFAKTFPRRTTSGHH